MKTIAAFLFCLALGCQSCAHTGPTPNDADAGAQPSCATACANGATLGTAWATPTPQDHTCVEVCQNAARTVPWDVTCLTKAKTRAAAAACP